VAASSAGLGLVAVTLFSFLGSATWLGELTTHFRPHLAAAALVVMALAAVSRARLAALAGAACLLANAAPLVPYLGGTAVAAHQGSVFRVLTVNLHTDGADYESVAALIERERPDLVALTEIGPRTAPLVERVRDLLPTTLGGEREGPFEVLLLTRWRPEAYRVDRSVGPQFPVSRVRLCRETCLDVVALHAARPLDDGGSWRSAQLALAARLAADREGPAVLVGDLNLTPWSPAFGRLLDASSLRDTALGRGIAPTWLSSIPFIGLPIDHVLVSPDIAVQARRVGPDVGSDHFPVIAELVLPAD
jgi:endonuclease/exonuclease/phosphatase (EEP) superfamily protein YafD